MKQKFVKVMLRHLQKENDFGCICGWNEPGHNWADHLYEMLIRAEVLIEGEVEIQWGTKHPQSGNVFNWESRHRASMMSDVTGHPMMFRLTVTSDWE